MKPEETARLDQKHASSRDLLDELIKGSDDENGDVLSIGGIVYCTLHAFPPERYENLVWTFATALHRLAQQRRQGAR